MKTYAIDQITAIDEMLSNHNLAEATGVRSPIGDDTNDEFSTVYMSAKRGKKGEPNIRDFQSLVGSLLWVSRCSRPHISFAVHRATRRTHQPSVIDWIMEKRVARYLKTTKDMKLNMSLEAEKDVITVTSWSDADFAADKAYRKSITGEVLTVRSDRALDLQKADWSITVYHGSRIHLGVTCRARTAGIERVAEGDRTSCEGANEHANG